MSAGKKFSVGIRLVIMAVCYFLAVHYDADVQDAAQIAVVSFADDGVSAKTAESICEEEQGGRQEQDSGQEKEFGQNQNFRQKQELGQSQDFGQKQEDGQDQGSGQEQVYGNNQQQEQESTLSLCFWREQEDMRFSCKETGQIAQAAGLLIEGDPELVARESGILAWQEKGCVMDRATAQELFGTQQANGQLIWCGEEAYPVYGTFESLERTVVLRAESGTIAGNSAGGIFGAETGASEGGLTDLSMGSSDSYFGLSDGKFSGTGYDHLSLKASKGASVKTEAEQLLMRYGLSGDIADFTFPGVVCGNLLLVLPIVLAVGLVKSLRNCLWEERRPEEKRRRSRFVSLDGETEYGLKKRRSDGGTDITGSRNNGGIDITETQNDDGAGIAKYQNAKRKKRKVLGEIFCVVMMAATMAALFAVLRKYLQISADMIPTRWSDFSFWPQWWAGQKANLLQILGGAQGEMQLESLWSFGLSLVCNIFAIGTGISLLNTEQ